jgi:hypothetical protein
MKIAAKTSKKHSSLYQVGRSAPHELDVILVSSLMKDRSYADYYDCLPPEEKQAVMN